MSKVLTILTNI